MGYLRVKHFRGSFLLLVLTMFLWGVLCYCADGGGLDRILNSGKLTVITDNNSNCYYTYRGKPMGFEYELTRAFADYLGVELEVITPEWEDMFDVLNKGKGNLIAASMTITPARKKLVDFSDQYLQIQQHVIIHKDNHKVKNIEDLAGVKVHVRNKTSYQERLLELKEDGLDIKLVLHDNVPTEELIRRVAEKEIKITVADTNIAFLNRRYYPDIRIAFPIAKKQSLGWAVKTGERKLLRKINHFFDSIKEDGTFAKIYEKYYASVKIFDYVDLKKFYRSIEIRLPKYEHVIREESDRYGFDWRLIVAVIYQESHLNPLAISYKGVRGLMQLTLITAEEMEIENRIDPKQSIAGGVKYLDKMYKLFKDIEGFDRMLYALASYNIGYGHVRDAQKIAMQNGLDPNKWLSLKRMLPLLRYREHYKKTKYGYARGTEPVRYVNRIIIYYDILRRKSSE